MATYLQMSGDEVARLGKARYAEGIRAEVEMEDNISKMVITDVETGDYEVDEMGLEAAHHLHAKRPDAPLYGIRIGYKFAEWFGGAMERINP